MFTIRLIHAYNYWVTECILSTVLFSHVILWLYSDFTIVLKIILANNDVTRLTTIQSIISILYSFSSHSAYWFATLLVIIIGNMLCIISPPPQTVLKFPPKRFCDASRIKISPPRGPCCLLPWIFNALS